VSNGINDTVIIQAAINAVSAAANAAGTQGTIYGAPGETYKVNYNGSPVTLPLIGAVTPALVIASNVVLDSVNIDAPDWPGFQVGVVVGPTGSSNWGVRNCRITGNARSDLTMEYLHSGILFGSCSEVTISHNTFNLFRESAVEGISADGNPSSFIRVMDNTITLCQGGAIKLDNGATDIWIERNSCINNLGIASGTYNGAECVLLNDSTGVNARCHINDNLLVNWGPCILLGCGSSADISGNCMAPPAGGSCVASAKGVLSFCTIVRNLMIGSD
jgi:hypothetical protein